MQLSRSFQWRGRAVAWDRFGNGEDPPVVMCHGTPWSSAGWLPFARALSREFTVHVWDMPGYGQSSMRPEHAVDLGTQAELFAALLAHWHLDRPHVVAHDYGGAVSLRAHLLHHAAFASLALVDVVALSPWGSDFFRLVAENEAVFAAQPMSVHRGALEAYVSGASHRGLTRAQLDEVTYPWLTEEGRPAFYRQIAAADQRFTDEIEGRYADIAMPALVVWGREDTWIPVDRAHRLADAIPGAELEIIESAGHLIQYDAPVELATSLHRWLASRARQSA